MSKIKSKNTYPEIVVRKYLYSKGFRYRLHNKKLPGKPDIVLSKYNTIIFVNGCFWHGHRNCPKFRLPKSNNDYWVKKITSNIERDNINLKLLSASGWNVLTIWECELKRATIERELYLKDIFEEIINNRSKCKNG